MKGKLAAAAVIVLAGSLGLGYRKELVDWISNYLKPPLQDPVPIWRLTKRSYTVSVTADGELTGLQTIPVSVPQVRTGSLKIAWMAEEGTLLQAGQVVVGFDSREALLSLEQNQNSFTSYEHRIEKAEGDGRSQNQILGIEKQAADLELVYAENQVVTDEEIFSRWEIQEKIMSAALARYKQTTVERKQHLNRGLSQADLRILTIERQKAHSEMKLAEQTLSSLEAKAPAEGVVLYRRWGVSQLKVGDDVWSGQPIVDIANMRQFKGRVQVPETDVAGVERGKKVSVVLSAFPGRTWAGKITQVAAVAQQISRRDPRKYFTCDVLLEVAVEILQELKPGMQLTGTIEVEQRQDVLVVPKSAVFKKQNAFVVFVKQGEQYVEKGIAIADSDHGFHVIEGAREGDLICLRHPFQKENLHLPDFSAPGAPTQMRRFIRVM